MPKSTTSAAPGALTAPSAPEPTSHELVRARADQLFRAAAECCRQHERYSHLTERGVDDGELKGVFEVVALCDRLLCDAGVTYEKASARTHPDGPDGEWWRLANALWMAAREYERRHDGCDQAARRMSAAHDPRKFAELRMDYELEASALLSLKQAVEAYRRVRPESVERPAWRVPGENGGQ